MCQCLHQGHPCEWLKGNLLVKEPEKEKKTWPTQQAQIQVSKTYRKSSNQKISISNCAEEAWGLSKQGGCRRTIWWPHCFCVLHHSTGVLRSGGTLASFWSLALQGVRGPVGKYILFPNETTPKKCSSVSHEVTQGALTSMAEYVRFTQANPTELEWD